MTFQYDNPDQEVYAIYREKTDGQLIPETWELTRPEAEAKAADITELSGCKTVVKLTLRGYYSQDIAQCFYGFYFKPLS